MQLVYWMDEINNNLNTNLRDYFGNQSKTVQRAGVGSIELDKLNWSSLFFL